MLKPREIHNYIQGNSVFHMVACALTSKRDSEMEDELGKD